MITDIILAIVLAPVMLLISMLPTVSLSIPQDLVLTVSNVFAGIGYFLPVRLILAIISIQFLLKSSRIIVALVVRIKSFIPTMGS